MSLLLALKKKLTKEMKKMLFLVFEPVFHSYYSYIIYTKQGTIITFNFP